MARLGEIRQLTGVRGVAALSVALVHLHFDRFGWVRFFEFHDQAVDLFFCLSGFTLCMVYQAGAGRLAFRRYFLARVARVYPLYFVILAFCWWLTVRHLVGFSVYPERLFIADAVRNLLLVNAWPLIGDGSNWDAPAWSLSVEAFCYVAVFPALFALSPVVERWSQAGRLVLVLLLTVASFAAFSRYWDVQILVARAYTALNPVGYWVPLLRGVTLFSAGWLMHGFWRQRGVLAQAAGAATDAIAVAVLLVLACAWFGLLPKAALVLLAPPLVLGLAVNDRAVTSRLLASPPIHFLGEISYAIYLLHEPLGDLLGHFPPLTASVAANFGLTLAALLALSTASYYGFEKPMRGLIKRGAPAKLVARPAATS
jgi:peptidoglycan/LPS O-acetylase OafA/YrhL